LFASATASLGVRNGITATTGPKISVCATVLDGATFVTTVGRVERSDRRARAFGCHTSAPSARPCSTSAAMRSSCTGATTAPMSTVLSSGRPSRSFSRAA
jgi:hypothetical protein